jgi:hypothetical protein
MSRSWPKYGDNPDKYRETKHCEQTTDILDVLEVTLAERKILRHTLGLERAKAPYRNRFVTNKGTTDYPICESLVAKGLMKKQRDPFDEINESYLYYATETGFCWAEKN